LRILEVEAGFLVRGDSRNVAKSLAETLPHSLQKLALRCLLSDQVDPLFARFEERRGECLPKLELLVLRDPGYGDPRKEHVIGVVRDACEASGIVVEIEERTGLEREMGCLVELAE
jgi:hypothetical protein